MRITLYKRDVKSADNRFLVTLSDLPQYLQEFNLSHVGPYEARAEIHRTRSGDQDKPEELLNLITTIPKHLVMFRTSHHDETANFTCSAEWTHPSTGAGSALFAALDVLDKRREAACASADWTMARCHQLDRFELLQSSTQRLLARASRCQYRQWIMITFGTAMQVVQTSLNHRDPIHAKSVISRVSWQTPSSRSRGTERPIEHGISNLAQAQCLLARAYVMKEEWNAALYSWFEALMISPGWAEAEMEIDRLEARIDCGESIDRAAILKYNIQEVIHPLRHQKEGAKILNRDERLRLTEQFQGSPSELRSLPLDDGKKVRIMDKHGDLC